MAATLCPWCKAPRASGPKCPGCGADYAKAEMIRAHGRAAVAPAPAAPPAPGEQHARLLGMDDESRDPVDDWRLELRFCIAAIPAALLAAALFNTWDLGHSIQRLFTMPIHELGHALAGWFCGYLAIPTLWKTLVPESRGFVAPLGLFAILAWLAWKAWRAERPGIAAAVASLVLVQLYCTFGIREKTAQMLIVFSGDGLGMVLGVALMCTFFMGKRTQIYRGSLRWGFVFIGAAAFVDMWGVWLRSRLDFGKIPFGELDNVGLTDATKLVDDHGWTEVQLIRRFVLLGILCLVVLAAVYARGVLHAQRQAARARIPLPGTEQAGEGGS